MFLRSLLHVATVDPGFDVAHGITARLTLEENRFTEMRRHVFAEALVERVSSIPGVTSASFASLIPLGGNSVGRRAQLRDRPDWNGMRVGVSNVTSGRDSSTRWGFRSAEDAISGRPIELAHRSSRSSMRLSPGNRA